MPHRMAVFGVVVTVVMSGVATFLGWRLISPFRLGSPWNLAAWLLLALLVLLMPITFWLGRVAEGAGWSYASQWVAYLAMGLVSFFFAFVVLREVVWGLLRLWDALGAWSGVLPAALPSDPMVRLAWLARSNLAIFGLSGVLVLGGLIAALRGPRIVEISMPVDRLPSAFEGYRIVQLSDVHLSPTIRGTDLGRWVEDANRLSPDLVVITGDLVDGTVHGLAHEVEPLLLLQVPVVFVTGNHEYYWGPEAWVAHLRSLGIQVLLNEHILLHRGDDTLVLAGITDARAGDFLADWAPDPERALAGAPVGAPRIMLAHQPRSAPSVRAAGADVQISGHTHGGQYFPWNVLIRWVEPYVAGLYDVGGMQLYVSRGTGWWGPPLRFGSQAEITLFVLRPSRDR